MLRPPVVTIAPARSESTSQRLSRSVEPTFLERQAVQNLPLPTLLDALDPHR